MLKLFAIILSAGFVAGCIILFFQNPSILSGLMVLISALVSPVGEA